MSRAWIPNSLTSLNLLSGCIGIVFAISGDLLWASWFIWFSAVLDFLDGFMARSLNAYSEIGKQLDSLADLISFGVLPGSILYSLMHESTENPYLPYIGFILTVFSAWRLAKFNLDEEQTDSFKGLPTPSSAIFVSGLIHIQWTQIQNTSLLIITTLVLSFLMVSNIPMMALKFKNYGWKENLGKYLFLLTAILTLILLGLEGITAVILIYILFSLFVRNKSHQTT